MFRNFKKILTRFHFILGIGENLREAVVNSIKKEYEERSRQAELEMEQILTRQRDTQLETERSKFSSKLESIKAQLKSDYDNILKVCYLKFYALSVFGKDIVTSFLS
jgi:uncharacterized protein YlxW (UPF0749 family)